MENSKTKFWHYSQNNSGGYFVVDEKNGVCEEVIIEAKNTTEAWKRLKKIGSKTEGFFSFCDCCGKRWYNFDNEFAGTSEPMIYGVPINQVKKGAYRKNCFIHYSDGKIKEVVFE